MKGLERGKERKKAEEKKNKRIKKAGKLETTQERDEKHG